MDFFKDLNLMQMPLILITHRKVLLMIKFLCLGDNLHSHIPQYRYLMVIVLLLFLLREIYMRHHKNRSFKDIQMFKFIKHRQYQLFQLLFNQNNNI